MNKVNTKELKKSKKAKKKALSGSIVLKTKCNKIDCNCENNKCKEL